MGSTLRVRMGWDEFDRVLFLPSQTDVKEHLSLMVDQLLEDDRGSPGSDRPEWTAVGLGSRDGFLDIRLVMLDDRFEEWILVLSIGGRDGGTVRVGGELAIARVDQKVGEW